MLDRIMSDWVSHYIRRKRNIHTIVSLWSDENRILVNEYHRRQKGAEKETLDEWRVRYGYYHWSKRLTENSLD